VRGGTEHLEISRHADVAGGCQSHPDPLHLIKAEFFTPAIIELRRACAGVVRHLRRLLQRAAFFRYAVIPVARKL
jgi:hypothetical protein